MGVLYYGDILNGDQDALSCRNEWAFLIMAKSFMAIKVPPLFCNELTILILAISAMAIKMPCHVVMNGHLIMVKSTMVIKMPYHVIMNGHS